MLCLKAAAPSPTLILSRKGRAKICRCFCSSHSSESTLSPSQRGNQPLRVNHAGVRLEETAQVGASKTRLDTWISTQIGGVSRARIQASIRSGLVSVNGRIINKVSHSVKSGDRICCTVSELEPLRAEPEDIPLDIVFEDAHLLVVNKPAHMVVHPAPGNPNGTLVNAILHHCQLPSVTFLDQSPELEDDSSASSDTDSTDFFSINPLSRNPQASVRPGIVHRLDKGTSGLLVVAKDEHSHACLAEQFKEHSIRRVYISLTCGAPPSTSGRVQVPIARDPVNRIRMAAVSGSSNIRGARFAASRFKLIKVLAGRGAALVEWRLETGRTHQIRVHAKYMGIPLLGDELYGGTKSLALSLLKSKNPNMYHSRIAHLVSSLDRPCLHALSIGFKHPHTGEQVDFSCPPPPDFSEILDDLHSFSSALTSTKS